MALACNLEDQEFRASLGYTLKPCLYLPTKAPKNFVSLSENQSTQDVFGLVHSHARGAWVRPCSFNFQLGFDSFLFLFF